ncbi:glycosyltransferase family 8 protein [Phascolarctobacterium faecium]|nr:glycosyltransferase family 8 protein [Phascolarctobacterium faecium]MDM8109169.1 glycosyltransferase family 8 protein [Phascolarctobacterium faecium]
MDNKINIVFASDNNYAQHTAVAMASVLVNTKVPQRIQFYLIDDEIQPGNKEKITKTVQNLGGNIEFIKIKNSRLEDCYVSGELSRASYFRLDIANILDESIEKIIYLDCDLLVYDDIEKMWQLDMGGMPVAATCDLGIMASARVRRQKNQFIGLPFDAPYFNAGVLMMDLKQWRSGNFAESIIALATQNKYPNHDQDALNKFFMNNWQEIPLRWDVIPPVFNLFLKIVTKPNLRKKALEAKLNPAIFHYAGGYKPWEYEIHEGFNEKYYEYLKLTEFKDAKMPQFDKRRKNRSIRRQMLRLKMGNLWAKIFG